MYLPKIARLDGAVPGDGFSTRDLILSRPFSRRACQMSGQPPSGSISFGEPLVTGRNRLPRPAAGITTFTILRAWLATQTVSAWTTSPWVRTTSRVRFVQLHRTMFLPALSPETGSAVISRQALSLEARFLSGPIGRVDGT